MKPGISLIARTVLVTRDDKLERITLKKYRLLIKSPTRNGFCVSGGVLYQWGEKRADGSLRCYVTFPVMFSHMPTVLVTDHSGLTVIITEVTLHGFRMRGHSDLVSWKAYAPHPN